MQYFKNIRINAKESMMNKKSNIFFKVDKIQPCTYISLTHLPQSNPDLARMISGRVSEDPKRYS